MFFTKIFKDCVLSQFTQLILIIDEQVEVFYTVWHSPIIYKIVCRLVIIYCVPTYLPTYYFVSLSRHEK